MTTDTRAYTIIVDGNEAVTIDDQVLYLSVYEVDALHKTLGIAIDNLSRKIAKAPPNSRAHRDSTADYSSLIRTQRKVLEILAELAKEPF